MRSRGTRIAAALASLALLAACSTPAPRGDAPRPARKQEEPPTRITIRPDDYHVPYAGTAEDGRRFFLSRELFEPGGASYVGLFLWQPDGSYDEVVVDEVRRPRGVPAGQAAPAGADELVEQRLAELGDYTLEPITVAPFTERIDGVTFGWKLRRFRGTYTVFITPGDFIAYYAPWNGRQYDT
jgi:hypothetical protein